MLRPSAAFYSLTRTPNQQARLECNVNRPGSRVPKREEEKTRKRGQHTWALGLLERAVVGTWPLL